MIAAWLAVGHHQAVLWQDGALQAGVSKLQFLVVKMLPIMACRHESAASNLPAHFHQWISEAGWTGDGG
jgi:hypothetical protein